MKGLIADDNTFIISVLKQIFNYLNIISRIEEVNDWEEVFYKIKSDKYDFVIFDPSMPGNSGLNFIKAIKDRNENDNLLILSMNSRAQLAFLSIWLGVSRYILKDKDLDKLELVIKQDNCESKFVTPNDVRKDKLNINNKFDNFLHSNLSYREFQVMCLLAKGTSLKEIGKKLLISEKTVTTYRSRVLQKMKMKSNSELALYAYKNNLME